MARLAVFFPELVHQQRRSDPRFRAEVTLYDAFDKQLPGGWRVFYNVGWLNRKPLDGSLRDGESDFLLAHPHEGAVVIEVKGGVIRFDGNLQQWYSKDSKGVEHEIKNPFQQAKDSKHTLIEKLKELSELTGKWVDVFHAVCFPDCDRPEYKINEEAYPEIIIGRQDMHRLPARLGEILKYSLGGKTYRHGREIGAGLEFLLARSTTLPNPLQSQLDAEHREIHSLTVAQINHLTRFQRMRRIALSGPAGSGKTYLAVYMARKLAEQGFRVLFTCYSAPLSRYLKSLADKVPGIEVLSAAELALTHAPKLKPDEADPDNVYPLALLEAMTAPGAKKYDAVLVDEGQDFTRDWWDALQSCLVEGRKGVFWVFHDSNNQVVLPNRGELPDSLELLELDENVRNTQKICEALLPRYKGQIGLLPRGPAGKAIEHCLYTTEAELKERLGKVLDRLLRLESILARDIVVLTPSEPGRDSALLGMGFPNGITLVNDERLVKGRSVFCSSIAQFKGLERPVVIVAELDDRLPTDAKLRDALLYVAFSRPRGVLIVFHTPAAGLAFPN